MDPDIVGTGHYASQPKPLYQPLDFDTFEIRLLELQWRRDHSGIVHMRCSLVCASLINPPDYIALSYCWGDATNPQSIAIDNWGAMEVTENLSNALKQLRFLYDIDAVEEGKTVLVWVDALCINQQDYVERSQQVRQMRQIYSRAKEVISFVPCSSGEAVQYLMRSRFDGEECETDDPEASLEDLGNRKEWVRQGWNIMEDLFSQAYWSRVWVIQEVAVAAKVKVLCGNYEVPWDDVAAVLAKWKTNPESVPIGKRAYLKAMHLAEFRDNFQIKRKLISLLDALRWSYQTEATDPRDKIFALLGLCHDGTTYVPVPNYKQPLEEIIVDMSKTMMSFDRSLDLMCLKGTSQEQNKLPSWTPNWTNLWSGALHSMTVHEAKYGDWYTSFPFNPVLEGSTNQILKVEGIFRGRIRRLTSSMAQPDSDGNIAFDLEPREPCIEEYYSPTALSPAPAEDQNSVWKTLTMGLLPPEISGSAAAFCFSKLWMPEGRGRVHNNALIEWIDRNSLFRFEWRSLEEWSKVALGASFSGVPADVTSIDTDWKFFDISVDTLERTLGSGMRLASVICTNANSELIAMVPPNARLHDQMWFVKGCSLPVLLREADNMTEDADNMTDQRQYNVIGGAYVDDTGRWKMLEDEKNWARGEKIEWVAWNSEVLDIC
jgi:Heterokaryon incompatibility protein (HET)